MRVRYAGQETWYRQVESISSDGHYLTLTHVGAPYRTFHHLTDGRLNVLVCRTGEDVTQALREERIATYQTGIPGLTWDELVDRWVGR